MLSFIFTRRGLVNFGLSSMQAASRTSAAAIGSKEEDQEMDIKFLTERDQIIEGLGLLEVVKTVTPFRKFKI